MDIKNSRKKALLMSGKEAAFFVQNGNASNKSTLFSKGTRTTKFFTEDSRLYITPREMDLIGAGVRLNRKLHGWDAISSKVVSEYRIYNCKHDDLLFEWFKSRYEAARLAAENVSNGFWSRTSFSRIGNSMAMASMLLGMFSMTMIYKNFGQKAIADKVASDMFSENRIAYSANAKPEGIEREVIAKKEEIPEANIQSEQKEVSEKKNDNLRPAIMLDKNDGEAEENRKKDTDKLPESSSDKSVSRENGIQKEPEQDGGVKVYEVQKGDTISSIAKSNGITINTILWANNIEDADSIHPGDSLFLLPTSGVVHKIAEGDTLEQIATKYGADKDKIVAFNNIKEGAVLEIGSDVIIPDGENGTSYQNEKSDAPVQKNLAGESGGGHKFPYGYCTWYVSQKRYVPWSGNAGSWLYRAKSLGYETGIVPKEGAIMVTTEDRYYGHVAYVEKVEGNQVTISEMNYKGWANKSQRILEADSGVIRGYIY